MPDENVATLGHFFRRKHFNTLVDIMRRMKDEDSLEGLGSLKDTLARLLPKAELLSFPTSSREIHTWKSNDRNELIDRVHAYLDYSRQRGTPIYTPWPVVAVEDLESVVLMAQEKGHTFVAACGTYDAASLKGLHYLIAGQVTFVKHERGTRIELSEASFNIYEGKKRDIRTLDLKEMRENVYAAGGRKVYALPARTLSQLLEQEAQNLMSAVNFFCQELACLMDMDVWLLRVESNSYFRQKARDERRKKAEKVAKIETRPFWIGVGTEVLRQFANSNAKYPSQAHPVAGHSRTYTHERYRAFRGQTVQIAQTFTGDGYIIGRRGFNYVITVKDEHLIPRVHATHKCLTAIGPCIPRAQ